MFRIVGVTVGLGLVLGLLMGVDLGYRVPTVRPWPGSFVPDPVHLVCVCVCVYEV